MSMLTIQERTAPVTARNKKIYTSDTGGMAGSAVSIGGGTVQDLQGVMNEGNVTDKPLIAKNAAGFTWEIYVDENNNLRLKPSGEGTVVTEGDFCFFAGNNPIPTWWDDMPVASAGGIGGVKIGNGLVIGNDGTLSVDPDSVGGVSSWGDLTDKPAWLDQATLTNFQNAHAHSWAQISNKPAWLDYATQALFEGGHGHAASKITGLATVATSGSYSDLSNKPSLFSGNYNDLNNKPSLNYLLLTGGTISGNLNIGGYVDLTDTLHHRENIEYLNSAGNAWVTWFNRNNGSAYINNVTYNGNTIYHSGNLNRSDVDFTAREIRSTGNVGIGTTSPSGKLEVNGDIRSTDWIYNYNSGFGLYNLANSTGIYSDVYGRMRIAGNGSFMVDGNVGIGTAPTSEKLDVAGSIHATVAHRSPAFKIVDSSNNILWTLRTDASGNLEFRNAADALMGLLSTAGKLTLNGDIEFK